MRAAQGNARQLAPPPGSALLGCTKERMWHARLHATVQEHRRGMQLYETACDAACETACDRQHEHEHGHGHGHGPYKVPTVRCVHARRYATVQGIGGMQLYETACDVACETACDSTRHRQSGAWHARRHATVTSTRAPAVRCDMRDCMRWHAAVRDCTRRGIRDGMRQYEAPAVRRMACEAACDSNKYKSTGSAVRHARLHAMACSCTRLHAVRHARRHATDTDRAGCTTVHRAQAGPCASTADRRPQGGGEVKEAPAVMHALRSNCCMRDKKCGVVRRPSVARHVRDVVGAHTPVRHVDKSPSMSSTSGCTTYVAHSCPRRTRRRKPLPSRRGGFWHRRASRTRSFANSSEDGSNEASRQRSQRTAVVCAIGSVVTQHVGPRKIDRIQ